MFCLHLYTIIVAFNILINRRYSHTIQEGYCFYVQMVDKDIDCQSRYAGCPYRARVKTS